MLNLMFLQAYLISADLQGIRFLSKLPTLQILEAARVNQGRYKIEEDQTFHAVLGLQHSGITFAGRALVREIACVIQKAQINQSVYSASSTSSDPSGAIHRLSALGQSILTW